MKAIEFVVEPSQCEHVRPILGRVVTAKVAMKISSVNLTGALGSCEFSIRASWMSDPVAYRPVSAV